MEWCWWKVGGQEFSALLAVGVEAKSVRPRGVAGEGGDESRAKARWRRRTSE